MHYYFITGTSSGLGKAIAEILLVNENNFVAGIGRHNKISHVRYMHHQVDLSDPAETSRFNFTQFPGMDQVVLINNAGSLGEIGISGNLKDENIITTYNLNCISPHILIGKFISSYENHSCKKVVINITSGAASSSYDGWSIYCASKAALNMMTLCIAREQELRKSNVKILAVAPGVMDTKMQEEIRAADEEEFSKKEKFVELKNNDQLYNVQDVAKKIIDIANNASTQEETIQRIVL